jgi:hypothetical protein
MTFMSSDTAKHWGWVIVPAIGALLVLAFLALPEASIEQSVVYDVTGGFAIAAAIVGIGYHRPLGWRAWMLIAAGQLAFVVGDIIWTVYATQGLDPFPSSADLAYVLGYPVTAIGLLLAILLRVTGGDRAGLLDAAILATGAAVIWWAFVLGPLPLRRSRAGLVRGLGRLSHRRPPPDRHGPRAGDDPGRAHAIVLAARREPRHDARRRPRLRSPDAR